MIAQIVNLDGSNIGRIDIIIIIAEWDDTPRQSTEKGSQKHDGNEYFRMFHKKSPFALYDTPIIAKERKFVN